MYIILGEMWCMDNDGNDQTGVEGQESMEDSEDSRYRTACIQWST